MTTTRLLHTARASPLTASAMLIWAGTFESGNLTTPALTRIGDRDAFAFKLDPAGNLLWAKNFGGSVA